MTCYRREMCVGVAVRPPGATPPARPGMPPEGVLAVVCRDNPRDNTRGKALLISLPSRVTQEECPWRLSDGWCIN